MQLMTALTQGNWSIPCDNKESWDGVRCLDYCDVKAYCPKGQLVNKLEKLEEPE